MRNRFRVADCDKFYQNVFPVNVNAAATTVGIQAYNNLTTRKNVFNQTDLIFSVQTGNIRHTFLTGLELGRQETFNRRETGTFTLPNSACLSGSTTTNCVVNLSAEAEGVVLKITDNSPGIPEAEFPNVIRRFYRLDASRGTAGAGLGLPLVVAIAEAHKAKIGLGDNRPGLSVRIVFPLLKAEP